MILDTLKSLDEKRKAISELERIEGFTDGADEFRWVVADAYPELRRAVLAGEAAYKVLKAYEATYGECDCGGECDVCKTTAAYREALNEGSPEVTREEEN